MFWRSSLRGEREFAQVHAEDSLAFIAAASTVVNDRRQRQRPLYVS